MIYKAKKYPKLSEWKRVIRRYRQRVKQLEQKVKVLQDLLCNKPITPERLKLLGKEVESVLSAGETLQQRMCRYCDMAGYEYRKRGVSIEYDTPSGTTVTIFPNPIRHFGYCEIWNVYGFYDRHDRWGIKYITEPQAKYMYDFLEKKITELKQKRQENRQES